MSSGSTAIIGGAGFLGGTLARALVPRPVVLVDITPPDLASSSEFRKCDILDSAGLARALEGCELVFHKAASLGGIRSLDPARIVNYLEVNARGTLNVLEACSAAGVRRLIFDSSKEVFGSETESHPAYENPSASPRNFYGASKLIAENLVAAHHRRTGLECIILRYSRIRHALSPDVIRRFCEAAIADAPIVLTGSPDKTLDFVDLEDAVQANLLAIRYSGAFGLFHVSCGESMRLMDIARTIISLCGKPELPIHQSANGAKDFEPLKNCLDISRARAVLGFRPTKNLHDMIRATHEALAGR